jgi:hypothetical protein
MNQWGLTGTAEPKLVDILLLSVCGVLCILLYSGMQISYLDRDMG